MVEKFDIKQNNKKVSGARLEDNRLLECIQCLQLTLFLLILFAEIKHLFQSQIYKQ